VGYARGRSHSDLAVNDIPSTVVTLNSTINGMYSTNHFENNGMCGGNNVSGKTTSSSSSSGSNTLSTSSQNTQNSTAPGIVKYNSTNSTYSLINPQTMPPTSNSTQIASNSKSNTKNKISRPKSERDLNPFPGPTPGLGSMPWGARCRSQSHEAVTLSLSNPSLNAATLGGRNHFPSRPFSLHADSEDRSERSDSPASFFEGGPFSPFGASPSTPNRLRKYYQHDSKLPLSTCSSLSSLPPLTSVAEDVPILDPIRGNGKFRNLSLLSAVDEVQSEVRKRVNRVT
jgi:hypothetical protein